MFYPQAPSEQRGLFGVFIGGLQGFILQNDRLKAHLLLGGPGLMVHLVPSCLVIVLAKLGEKKKLQKWGLQNLNWYWH